MAYGTADGLGGHIGKAALLGDDAGNVAISHGVTVWDGEQDFPYAVAEVVRP